MSKKADNHLSALLTDYDVMGLGEGNRTAGANVLAAMAITLANISRTGSGIESPGLGRMRVGLSALVGGSLSSSLVTDNVITEAAIRQNILSAKLERLFGDKLADARKKGLKAIEFPSGPGVNPSENALFHLEQKDSLIPVDVLELWEEVLKVPPNPRIEDLVVIRLRPDLDFQLPRRNRTKARCRNRKQKLAKRNGYGVSYRAYFDGD